MYTTFLASAFRSIRFGVNEAHGRGIAMQLNYLLDQGAFVVRPDGTFTVDEREDGAAVTALTREIMTLQAEGSYPKAKALIDTLGVVRPEVQKVLDRLTGVPVDIEPKFTTAATLGDQASADRPARSGRSDPGLDAAAHSRTTGTATSGRSLMMLSAPQSSSRSMSPRSSTVQIRTGRPARWACAMNRGVTTTVVPARSGTWNSRYFVSAERPAHPRAVERPPRLLARGAGRNARLVAARRVERPASGRSPSTTRSSAPAARTSSIVRRASSASGVFSSMMTRAWR